MKTLIVVVVVGDWDLVEDDLMEVALVLIGVLAIVDGSELEDSVAAGGSSRSGSRSALRDASSSGVRANGRLLRVRGRSSGSQRKEPRGRDGSQRKELLRGRHFEIRCVDVGRG